jgi:hypothetical protein
MTTYADTSFSLSIYVKDVHSTKADLLLSWGANTQQFTCCLCARAQGGALKLARTVGLKTT